MDSKEAKRHIQQLTIDRIRQQTENGREALAKKYLNYDSITEYMEKRASLGYDYCIIKQDENINITATMHARSIKAKFESKGFKVSAVSFDYEYFHKIKPDEKIDNRYIQKLAVPMMRISWKQGE